MGGGGRRWAGVSWFALPAFLPSEIFFNQSKGGPGSSHRSATALYKLQRQG